MPTCGIYKIALDDGRSYIGQSINIERRWLEHRSRLRHDTHYAPYLQNAWNKYGEDAFSFEVLESISTAGLLIDEIKSRLTRREQFWMDKLSPEFNAAPAAGSMLGYEHSPESRAKMSESHIGHVPWNKGIPWSSASRAKMSAARLGKPLSPMNAARSRGLRKGATCTSEHRARISKSLRGHSVSDETRAKISATLKAKNQSGENLQEAREHYANN